MDVDPAIFLPRDWMVTGTSTPPREPNPGSDEALDLGCLCPILDNGHGRGMEGPGGGRLFWKNQNCPIHGGGDKR